MLNSTNHIRTIINLGGSSVVTIPKEFGFNTGDSVLVEKIDENSFKVTKVQWSKL